MLLFALPLLYANNSHAQQQNVDTAVISGHFDIDTLIGSEVNHINVNYVLSSKPFVSNVHVTLNTANLTLFNVDLLDASNTVLQSWAPSAISNSYDHDVDISILPPGNYHFNIRKNGSTAILNSVNFTK